MASILKFIMGKIFDKEVPFQEFEDELPEDMTGQALHVCTVRQEKMKDLPVGNVFWLLKAFEARERGARVIVTDFYDKPGSSNEGLREFMRMLDMLPEKGPQVSRRGEVTNAPDLGVDFRQAEDVPRNTEAWFAFVRYVREHADEKDSWQSIGTVEKGTDQVIEGHDYNVPENMERFLEELSVWVDGIDGDTLQIMNHEEETTAWVRRLYPEFQKEFWRVVLPIINEYRGKYKETVDEEQVIYQRRLKDLADKLIIGVGEEQTEEQYEFYRQVFDDLVDALDKAAKTRHRHSFGGTAVVNMLSEIDPRLSILYLKEMDQDELEKLTAGTDYSTPDKPFKDSEKLANTVQSIMAQIGILEAKKGKPSLSVLKEWLPLYRLCMEKFSKFARKKKNDKLLTVICDERVSMEEQIDFWFECVESGAAPHLNLHGHPLTTKLVQSSDLPPDVWKRMKEYYLSVIPYGLGLVKDIAHLPVVERVSDELMKEDPSRFFELIWRYGCDKHEVPKFVYGLQMDNKVSYRFLQYVVDRYRSLKGGKYMEIADEISRLIQFEDGDIPFNERSVEDIIEDHLRKTVADCNCDPDPELEPVEVPEHPYAEWSDWEDEN